MKKYFVKNRSLIEKRRKPLSRILPAIMTFCVIISLSTFAFAATDTSVLDNFITFICDWLKKIGALVMLIGGIMFAFGWNREDADGKTRGLQTLMAGAMVIGIGAAPDLFGL